MFNMAFSVLVALVSTLSISALADAGANPYHAAMKRTLSSASVATAYTTVTAEPVVITVIATDSTNIVANTTTAAVNAYDVLSDSFRSTNATLLNTTTIIGPCTSFASACSKKPTNTSIPTQSTLNCTISLSRANSTTSPTTPSTAAPPMTITSTTVIADSSPPTTTTMEASTETNGMIPGFAAASTVNANSNAADDRMALRYGLAGAGAIAVVFAEFRGAAVLLL